MDLSEKNSILGRLMDSCLCMVWGFLLTRQIKAGRRCDACLDQSVLLTFLPPFHSQLELHYLQYTTTQCNTNITTTKTTATTTSKIIKMLSQVQGCKKTEMKVKKMNVNHLLWQRKGFLKRFFFLVK